MFTEPKKQYKSWELYTFLALQRLAEELDIDIYQPGLEDKIDKIFSSYKDGVPSVTKVEISYEIKSNHCMTNKVLDKLVSDGLAIIKKDDRTYRVSITKKGVLHLRKFSSYFIMMYNDLIRDHYRYRRLPSWFEE